MKTYLRFFILFVILLLGISDKVYAAKRYWVATTTQNWSNIATQWALTSGGTAGASVPGSNDTAYFDGARVGSCTLNMSVSVKRLDIAAGYTGTISQGIYSITVGTGNAVLSGGTFSGGSAKITITGFLTISGTAFASTSDTLDVTGNFTLSSGSFTHRSGTVLFSTPNTISGTISFYKLTFIPGSAGSYTISNTITTNSDLKLSGTTAVTLNTGTIDAKGNITSTNPATGGGGSATITITGTGSQTLTGNSTVGQGALPKVTINKSSGTLTLASTISVANDWTWTAGTLSLGSSVVAFVNNLTITGSHTLGDVTFKSSSSTTYTIANTLTVSGTFTIDGTGALTFNTGTIAASGNVTVSNTSTGGGGTATIEIDGTSPTLTGASTAGQGVLPNLTFTNSSASTYTIATSTTLTVSSTLTLAGTGALTFNTGTIYAYGNVTSSNSGTGGGGTATITINGTGSQTLTGNSTVGNGALPKVTINKSSGTLTLASTISVANNWTWTAGTFSLGSSVVAFVNSLTITGSHTLGAVTFKSNSSTTYTIANTLTVSGTLTTDGTGALTFNTGTIAPTAAVNLNNSGTGGGGSATFSFNNTNNQTLTGNSTVGNGALPKVTINKSSGTLTLASTISVANNWTWTAGTLSLGSSVVAFVNSLTITGSHTLGAVTFKSNSSTTYTIANTLTVSGTLITDGTGALTFNTGTIAPTGDVTLSNSGTGGGGSATFSFNNTNNQTLTGNSTVGNGALPKVTINKSSGTLTLASTISVANDWTWTAGTFSLGSSVVAFVNNLTITGSHTLSAVTFKSSSSLTYTIANTLTVSGTLLIDGSGALTFNTGTIAASGNVTVSNTSTGGGGNATIRIDGTSPTLTGAGTAGQGVLPNLTFTNSSASTYTIATSTTLTVSGTLTLAGTGALTFNTGTIYAYGNVTSSNSGTGGGGTATITINGLGPQTLTGNSIVGQGALPKVTIVKTTGTGTGPLTLANTISVANDWTYTSGGLTVGSSVVAFVNSLTITGTHSLNDVTFKSNSSTTYTIVNILTVGGTLTTDGSGALTFNSGTIAPSGAVNINNSGTGGGGSTVLSFSTTSNQTLTGNSTVGNGALPKVKISKSSGTLTLANTISVANDWSYVAGTFSLGSSVVAFVNSLTISGSHTLGDVTFKSNSPTVYTILNTLTVSGTLTTNGSASLAFNTGTIVPNGAVNLNSSGTGDGGTATFSFTGTGNQTITGNSTVGTAVLPKVIINKSSGTLTLANTISVGNDWTYTAGTLSTSGSVVAFIGTLTISGNHTLGDVTFKSNASATFTVANTLTVSGTLLVDGSGALTFNTGTIAAAGNVTINNTSTGGGGTATIEIDGTSPTLTGAAANGQCLLPNVTFTNGSASTYSIASGTNLNVAGTLTLAGSGALTFNTGTINAYAAITSSNSGTGGGGTATIVINGTHNQTLTGNSTIGQGAFPKVTINKSSGTLTLANTISVANDWTWTAGTLSLGSSVVAFINNLTISGSHTLGAVAFKSNSSTTYTVANTLTVSGALTTDGSGALTFNTGTIAPTGDVTLSNSGTGGGGSATFSFNNTNNQTITGNSTVGNGALPKVTINKSSGTLTLANTISVANDWTWTAGTFSLGSSVVAFVNTLSIAGSHTLGNVYFKSNSSATYTVTNTLTSSGTLSIAGSGDLLFNTGTLAALGDITVTNSGTAGGGTATLSISGSGSQTLTGSGVAATGLLPNVTINKSGTLTLANTISCGGDWTYTAGTVVNTVTVVFLGNHSLNSSGMSFNNVTVYSGTRTLTSNADVNNDLSIGSGGTLAASSYTINLGGNWDNSGTWTYGTSTVYIDGTGYKAINKSSGTESFYNVTVNKTGGSLTLLSPVSIAHAMTLTQGHVKSTSAHYLEFADNATVSGAANNAYVHGPVRKTGDDAFTFPLGDTTLTDTSAYHPLAMTAPSSTGDQFEAEYLAHNQTVGDSLADTLTSISTIEYWDFERKSGSSSVGVRLGWNSNSDIYGFEDLSVAQWDGYKWVDRGQSAVTATFPQGNITASLTPIFSGPPAIHFVIGHAKKAIRYAVVRPKLDGGYFITGRILRFKFEEEYNTAGGQLTYRVISVGTNEDITSQLTPSSANSPVVNYGDNRFGIDLIDLTGSPLASGFYLLEVSNEKNEKCYLRFKL